MEMTDIMLTEKFYNLTENDRFLQEQQNSSWRAMRRSAGNNIVATIEYLFQAPFSTFFRVVNFSQNRLGRLKLPYPEHSYPQPQLDLEHFICTFEVVFMFETVHPHFRLTFIFWSLLFRLSSQTQIHM